MAAEHKTDPRADPVLRRLVTELNALYGERIERIVLFGSRARGEARTDSDYDVAVFLKDMTDRSAESRRLGDLSSELMDATGEDVQAIPFAAGAYRERTPLMHEIRLAAIDLDRAEPPLSLYSPSAAKDGPEMAAISPEAAVLMGTARRSLERARGNLEMNFPDQAGRLAYMAALNAARALIFERSGRVVKTHRGVRSRFGELTRNEPSVGNDLRRFLQDGFKLKQVADYFAIGDEPVSTEEATAAIETATRFVETVAGILQGG